MDPGRDPLPGSSSAKKSESEDDVPLARQRKDLKGKVKKSTNVEKQKDPKGKEVETSTEKKVPKGKEIKTSTEKKVPKGKGSEEAVGSANVVSDDGNDSEDSGHLQLTPDEASQGWSLTRRRRAMKVC